MLNFGGPSETVGVTQEGKLSMLSAPMRVCVPVSVTGSCLVRWLATPESEGLGELL